MGNLIIGENLSVLKNKEGLDESYKLIYLDPPYNTCSNKSYNDTKKSDEWAEDIKDRLIALKPYLSVDGFLMISIDDNEYATVRILCDEVFGKKNFLGTFITRQATRSNSKHINTIHEYIICYAKDKTKAKPLKIKRTEIDGNEWIESLQRYCYDITNQFGVEAAQQHLSNFIKQKQITWLKNYNLVDEDGRIFFASDLSTPSNPREVNISEIGLHLDPLETRGWVSDKRFIELHEKGLLHFRDGRPYEKKYLMESEDNAPSILDFYSRQGTHDLERLGLKGLFDTPKPLNLMKYLIRLTCNKGDKVLDIYGGCGTTAHACEELGIDWTLIQRDEEVKNPNVLKACEKYGVEKNIAAITKKRIEKILQKSLDKK